MAGARRGAFDLVVVYRADRLFRSLKAMVVHLDELAALGIGFVSVTEPFDTTTPQGRLLLHLVSAFAEFEKGVLVERTKAGIAAARRRGAKSGALGSRSTWQRRSPSAQKGRDFRRSRGSWASERRLSTGR